MIRKGEEGRGGEGNGESSKLENGRQCTTSMDDDLMILFMYLRDHLCIYTHTHICIFFKSVEPLIETVRVDLRGIYYI